MKSAPILLAALFLPSPAFAQGDLAPPGGAPVASMKTLGQVEPRTDVLKLAASPPYTINAPGSYYLTGNISVSTGNGINITVTGVTLDLNGFTIASTNVGGNGSGVALSAAATNATIRNGNILGGTTLAGTTYTAIGFLKGIEAGATTGTKMTDISFGGIAGTAVDCTNAAGATVSRCTVRVARLSGIVAENVDRCTVVDAGNYGIAGNIITACRATTVSTAGFGGIIGTGGTVTDCTATSSTGNAIEAKIVTNSYGNSTSSGVGILADNITNSTGTSSTGIGIFGQNVNGCTGSSTTNVGISSEAVPNIATSIPNGTVSNSRGSTNSGSFGIFSGNVNNSVGTSLGGGGIYGGGSVNNSTGRGHSSTYAIISSIAIGCRATGSLGIFAGVKQFCSE